MKEKWKKWEKNVLLSIGWFFSFVLILSPHPWHHTPWCHGPWEATISLWCWFPALLPSCRRGWSSSSGWGRKGGISFRLDTPKLSSRLDISIWHRPCPALPGALPDLPRLNGGGISFIKENAHHWKLIASHSLCICCTSATGESQGRSLTLFKVPRWLWCLLGLSLHFRKSQVYFVTLKLEIFSFLLKPLNVPYTK